ncbi:hypothetical protein ILUMI_26741 [Ignelater luminosus]|uniref:Glycerate kinase n=1 Tax=Ignelater luminosus TaxID=2038154 RepID=A0A8K0FX94_IGNLU|nr:hypothetical protein ILUMI_26741 [Ignelater luminosus]
MSDKHLEHLKSIFLKSVTAVQPEDLIKNSVTIENSNLIVNNDIYKVNKPCYVVGFGKAVFGMAITLESILGANLQEGIVTVPAGIFEKILQRPEYSKIRFVEGAVNNLPDENAESGAKQIKDLVEKLQEDDLLIVLISGGGSALLPLPKHPATLSEKLNVIKGLAAGGADIQELNCVRKRLSVLKGGGLAKLAYPANVISLILSDIIGDPLDYIASGPTTPNFDSSNAAVKIIEKYSLYDKLPHSIRLLLESENQSNDDGSDRTILNGQFAHVRNYIIGNNDIAARAALKQATALGYQSFVLSTSVSGEVDRISKIYAELARQVASLINSNKTDRENLKLFLKTFHADLNISESTINEIINLDFNSSAVGVCLIFAGEPTVVVKGNGRGGRNQQLALGFSIEINKFDIKSANISFLSCGTDGIDGPTDAAGAVGSSNLVNNALEENINPTQFLSNNDSYSFYSVFNSGHNLIRTGHTGTNVMDIHLLIVAPV